MPGEEDSEPYGILTSGEPAPASGQQDGSAAADRTRVTGKDAGKKGLLRSSNEASVPATITATADPGQQYVGSDVTIAGRLTANGAPIAGASITLFDAPDAIVRVYVADTTTDGSGGYQFTLTDTAPSQHSYIVHAPGSATYEPAVSDELLVIYIATPTAITATATPEEQVVGQSITITGRLTANGAPVADLPVTLYNADDIIERVYTANTSTDAEGNYQLTLTDTTPGHHSYFVHTPGTSFYAPVQSSQISVTFVTIPTAISATATPQQQYVGLNVTVTGQLTASGAPVAEATVTLYHAEDVEEKLPIAAASTDASGHFQLPPLTVTAATSHVYRVHYAGDSVHAPTQSTDILVHYEAQPAEATPAQAAPIEAPPTEATPARAAPAQAAPAQAAPAQAAPTQAAATKARARYEVVLLVAAVIAVVIAILLLLHVI